MSHCPKCQQRLDSCSDCAGTELEALRAKVRELEEAEVNLTNVIGQQRDTIKGVGKTYATQEKQLALAQLETKRLRDALHRISLGAQNSMQSKASLGNEARSALSTPADTTALDAYVAEQKAELRNQLSAVNAASHLLAKDICKVSVVNGKRGIELIPRSTVMDLIVRWRFQWNAAIAAQEQSNG
jgi:chromosome segregation ATPase